jgi:hypothetical protein
MWEQLSAYQKFRVVACGVLAPFQFFGGILLLSSGAGLRGLGAIAMGVYFAYMSYKTATSPPAAGVRLEGFNKCADCGRFTRDAGVCRHCGHTLTQSASGISPKNVPLTPPTTSDAPGVKGDETSRKARCHHCGHVQTVPVSQETFSCERCQANLKRRSAPANGS